MIQSESRFVGALGDLVKIPSLRTLLTGLAIMAAASGLAILAERFAGPVSAALVFVLGIIAVGALNGLIAAFIAALAAFVIYNVFLTEPLMILQVTTTGDVAPLIAFGVSALVAGTLAGQLKDRAQAVQRSNLQLASLLEASQDFQALISPADVLAKLSESAPARFGLMICVYQPAGDHLAALPLPGLALPPSEWDAVATRVWENSLPRVMEGKLTAVLLRGLSRPLGVLLFSHQGSQPAPEAAFLEALANLVALALERSELLEGLAEAKALARSEELKTALLSSVSHDLRTPLTTISASATSLMAYQEQLAPQTQRQLLRSIADECDRLNRYTANLLELSKLQAGVSTHAGEIVDAVEILGAAVQRVRPRLGQRVLERNVDSESALVRAAPALFELVLVNVLDNAISYSEDGTIIHLTIKTDSNEVRLIIADQGVGIPPEDLERIFTRFYRVDRDALRVKGSGLGLAIARGFVEAFSGHIYAESPISDGYGTRITIVLPRAS